MPKHFDRSFGPVIEQRDGGDLTALCTWCHFRIGNVCTYVKPSRDLPDEMLTPDWCEMKASMLDEVAQMQRPAVHREPKSKQ